MKTVFVQDGGNIMVDTLPILPDSGDEFEGARYSTHGDGGRIDTYDNCDGPLWIHRDTSGITGIVRAASFCDAYSICEDEFFPEASETIEELFAEYNVLHTYVCDLQGHYQTVQTHTTCPSDLWLDNACFQEAFGFRPNGPNAGDVLKHGIYAKDLNGESMELLTVKLAKELGIVLEIKKEVLDEED